MGDGAGTFVSWFLTGIATALAGGIVYVWTKSASAALLAGAVVLVVLRLAQAGSD